jgi:hypothetical protein
MKKEDVDAENHSMFEAGCSQCNEKNIAPSILCIQCEHILPFYFMNPFVIFQLTPKLNPDYKTIDPIYFSLQKKLHPDRVRDVSDAEHTWAEQHISQINQAYKALKEPILIAKAAALYIQDPRLSLDSFNDQNITPIDINFLQKIMQLQAVPITSEINGLYNAVMLNLDTGIKEMNLEKVLFAIGKLTYIERLRKLC